jgi:hypothetical protein
VKKLLIAFSVFASIVINAATITGPVGDLTGGAFNPRIEFWPLSTPFNIGNTNIVGPAKVVPVVGGNFSQLLVAGKYLVKFPPTTNSFYIHVPNDTGTYSLAAVSTNVSSVTGIANAPVYRVKATSSDTNAGFLSSKLVAGSGVTIATNNAGQDETLTITSSGSGTSGALTNNETRDVNFNNMDLFIVPGNFSFSSDGLNYGLEQVINSSGIVADAHIASTIARASEVSNATNGFAAGLAAGSHAINGSLTTNLVNTSSAYGRSIKANEFPFTFGAIGSNLPIRVLLIGDSLTANEESTAGLRVALDGWIPRAGYGSFFNSSDGIGGENAIKFGQSGLSGSSGIYSPMEHFRLSNGQIYGPNTGDDILANHLAIYYYAHATNGSMLVETQSVGGSYGTLATINGALGSGHIATNFTLASRDYYKFRITSTGNNQLLNVGLTDTTSRRSQIWAKQATPGETITNIVQSAAFWNFYTNYNPHLVIFEAKDEPESYYTALEWVRGNITNRDIIYITASPNDSDANIPRANETIIRYARTNENISVFDKYPLFMPTNFWMGAFPVNGSSYYEDGAHLGKAGVNRASAAFADWFNSDGSKFSVGAVKAATTTQTNTQYFTPFDTRLYNAGTIQTTVPVLSTEIFYGGLNLNQYVWYMASSAPRNVILLLPPNLVEGKKTIQVTQRWLVTNSQPIATSAQFHKLRFGDHTKREKIGSGASIEQYTGGNVTNIYTRTLSYSWSAPALPGDYVTCELGHGGTLTNSIWWMGAKVEAY